MDCMLDLGYTMASQGFWPQSNVGLMQAWVQDLAALGYAAPELKTLKAPLGTYEALVASTAEEIDAVGQMQRAQLSMASRSSCATLDFKQNSKLPNTTLNG
jgi:hypothetical protein